MTTHTTPADLDPTLTHHKVRDQLPMWVVTERPKDYPEGCVARLFLTLPAPVATDAAIYGPSLADVRSKLPQGLFCMPRHEADEPQIVEVWL